MQEGRASKVRECVRDGERLVVGGLVRNGVYGRTLPPHFLPFPRSQEPNVGTISERCATTFGSWVREDHLWTDKGKGAGEVCERVDQKTRSRVSEVVTKVGRNCR